MESLHSDALGFFVATGDLASKKTLSALQAMVKRGVPELPIIGVAKAGWNLEQLCARARDSVEQNGGLDAAAFDRLARQLRYVDGDYNDAATFDLLRAERGGLTAPAFYLAIPPALFGVVVEHIGKDNRIVSLVAAVDILEPDAPPVARRIHGGFDVDFYGRGFNHGSVHSLEDGELRPTLRDLFETWRPAAGPEAEYAGIDIIPEAESLAVNVKSYFEPEALIPIHITDTHEFDQPAGWRRWERGKAS